MTDTKQLNRWMRHDPGYLGAFPLDQLPHHGGGGGCCFIVNTHPTNLPGQHWIAVRIRHGAAWIFDPLSSPPMPELCNHLLHLCTMIHFCKTAAQPANSMTCGQHCVYYLHTGTAAPTEAAVLAFVHRL
jgi:hypothetical protein